MNHLALFRGERQGFPFARDGEAPRMVQQAARELVEAVDRDDRQFAAGEWLEVLGAYFSTPADDECSPFGIVRPT